LTEASDFERLHYNASKEFYCRSEPARPVLFPGPILRFRASCLCGSFLCNFFANFCLLSPQTKTTRTSTESLARLQTEIPTNKQPLRICYSL
jgi:hypothetical protein